jgi:5'-3' exonuclease
VGSASKRQKLKEHIQLAFLSRKLATLENQVPLKKEPEQLLTSFEAKKINTEAQENFFCELGVSALLYKYF